MTPNHAHGARRWILVVISSLLYRRLAVFEHGLSIDDALGERLYRVELSGERNIPRSNEPRSGRRRADGGNMLLRDAHCPPARPPGMTSFSRQPAYLASSHLMMPDANDPLSGGPS